MKIELITNECIDNIISWNENTNASFLQQWAGPVYSFPLTRTQIEKRMNEEKINTEMASTFIYALYNDLEENIGTIELNSIDYKKHEGIIGRFLINSKIRNKGQGRLALISLIEKAYNEFGIVKYRLKVLSFNKNAISCYERVGFKLTQKIETNFKDNTGGIIYVNEMKYIKN